MTPSAPVLAALRQATADAHRRIETVASLDTLADRAGLVRVLTAFSAFHAVWEPAAQAVLPPADAAWLAARSRRDWLAQDLRALAAAGEPLAALPALPVALQLPDAAAAWGSVYVLEGSTLGGQLIARHLRDTLGLTPETGARYHAGHGPRTAARWRECGERLQAALGTDAAACERACAAAVHTFDVLAAVLQCALHRPAVPAAHAVAAPAFDNRAARPDTPRFAREPARAA